MSGGGNGQGQLTAHYEQLRDDVVNHAGLSAHGFGLALLLQQGMTAWMRAWSEWTTELQTPSAPALPLAAPLPSAVRTQLTLILASMLTRPLQEACP
jgi:hypothetical protein